MTDKWYWKLYAIAEKWCNDYGFPLISLDTVLKGNRMDITIGIVGGGGKLVHREVTIGYGKQEIGIIDYIYTVIRNDNSDIGTDGISLYHFKTAKEAREWAKKDINCTMARCGTTLTEAELRTGKDYWVYDNDSLVIDWSIRKLPIQRNSIWTDPEYPVRYVNGVIPCFGDSYKAQYGQ